MGNVFKIGEAVRPLFVTQDAKSYHFAGTGFFLQDKARQLLVTANHVLGGLDLFVFAIPDGAVQFEFTSGLHPAKLVTRSVENDLAVFDVPDLDPGTTLTLAPEVPTSNVRIGTVEYSRFELNRHEGTLNPNPSTRIGNIVRQLNGDKHFPESSLELSYPALRGASGSPVITLEGTPHFQVCGIVVANAQYELMPVQTYTYRDSDGTEEEQTHYYLPSGVAINVHWLKQLLEGIQKPDAEEQLHTTSATTTQ